MKIHTSRRAVLAGAAATLMIPAVARSQPMRMRVSFDDQQVTYQLFDNPTTRDLISMLPAELEIEDFSNNEKIVHLPRRLDESQCTPMLLHGQELASRRDDG